MPHPELSPIPQHVAIIMDGNGRWAKECGLSRLDGHRAGAINTRRVVEILAEYGIKYLTLYGFSTENWSRPQDEINGLFQILEERIDEEIKFAQERRIKICHLGKLDGLPQKIKQKIEQALKLTQNNKAMTVSLAFNYGGRDEIVEAVRRLVLDNVPAQSIDKAVFSRYLYTASIPDPDLVIRTGGEMRLSNFLLWQVAYAEFYSTPTFWPDFNREEIEKALLSYAQRQRRFGSLTLPE